MFLSITGFEFSADYQSLEDEYLHQKNGSDDDSSVLRYLLRWLLSVNFNEHFKVSDVEGLRSLSLIISSIALISWTNKPSLLLIDAIQQHRIFVDIGLLRSLTVEDIADCLRSISLLHHLTADYIDQNCEFVSGLYTTKKLLLSSVQLVSRQPSHSLQNQSEKVYFSIVNRLVSDPSLYIPSL